MFYSIFVHSLPSIKCWMLYCLLKAIWFLQYYRDLLEILVRIIEPESINWTVTKKKIDEKVAFICVVASNVASNVCSFFWLTNINGSRSSNNNKYNNGNNNSTNNDDGNTSVETRWEVVARGTLLSCYSNFQTIRRDDHGTNLSGRIKRLMTMLFTHTHTNTLFLSLTYTHTNSV